MIRKSLESLRRRVGEKLDDYTRQIKEEATSQLAKTERSDITAADEDLPVVARMVVEIRSDGSRTIARGAMEDLQHGDRFAIRATGTTPARLAASLAKSIVSVPLLARAALQGLKEPHPDVGKRGNGATPSDPHDPK